MEKKKIVKVLREYSENHNLQLYSLDWDDNILGMPTTIKMDKKVVDSKGKEKWRPIDVSTEEFALIRSNPNYRPRNNDFQEAFIDFTLPDTFLNDTKKAIEKNQFSPSFNDLKSTLVNANPFAIITARGHSPKIIKEGVKIFIDIVLTDDEKEKMVDNIRKVFEREGELEKIYKTKQLNSFEQIIDVYLRVKGRYYPVSSKEFGIKAKLDSSKGASSPEYNKQLALRDFVYYIYNQVKKYIVDGTYKSIQVGFSDDDKKNVEGMIEYIQNELSSEFPEIEFTVIDTSSGGKNKIKISGEKQEESESLLENFIFNRIKKLL